MNSSALELFIPESGVKDRALAAIGDLSRHASKCLSKDNQSKFAQYFTEGVIAQTMAKRLTIAGPHLRIGDHGAGAGVLGASTLVELLHKHGFNALDLHAYEIDKGLHPFFLESMAQVEQFASDVGGIKPTHVLNGDFTTTSKAVVDARKGSLNGAVINPPYQKLHQGSDIARFMKEHYVPVPNQYALFVVLTVDMLKAGGEMVAIIPRSFMSGSYFKDFRAWLRAEGSIDWFHRYQSRSNVFRGDNVLQENVLIKFTKGKAQVPLVEVSVSNGPEDKECEVMSIPAEVIFDKNPQGHMTLPCSYDEMNHLKTNSLQPYGFQELGLTVNTGKFEDFRNREALHSNSFRYALPIVYAQHWQHGETSLVWRGIDAKPCFAWPTEELRKRVIPRGNYVLVKRISANGDKARCHCVALLEDAKLPGNQWLIDNHVQIISSKAGLTRQQALNIQRHFSSQKVEAVLRAKSGTTQLNRDDLRAVRFPRDCATTH